MSSGVGRAGRTDSINSELLYSESPRSILWVRLADGREVSTYVKTTVLPMRSSPRVSDNYSGTILSTNVPFQVMVH